MGGDGGTIHKRIELVRTRKKPEQVRFTFNIYFAVMGLNNTTFIFISK